MNIELFIDYYRGLSQRELERKYDMPQRTIAWQCKKTMNYLFNTKGCLIHENIEQIKKEIEKI